MNMRRGVTLLEVLFSIILLSVGILGSVAVFSMAMAQARKGRTADTVQVAAHSAVSSFTAEGMDDRTRWLRWDAANSQTAFFPLNMNDAPSASAPNPYYGRAFCIDPRGFEQNRITDIQQGQTNSGLWAWFPAVPEVSPTPNAVPNGSRMMRLTLTNGPTGAAPMPFAMADKLFRVEDELIYERPEDNTLPAIGLHTQVDTGSGNIAGRRQEEGRATWMATLVPKLAPAKEARLELQGGTYVERKLDVVPNEYVLSVAVFYNRTPDMEVPNAGDRPWNEWTAKVLSGDFHAQGNGGGEITITTNDPAQDPTFNAEQYLDIARGSWLMLARTVPTATTPIQHWQWYRVSDASDVRPSGNRWERDVTLIGGDWPVDLFPRQVAGGQVTHGDGTQDECDVVIVPNVAHVYERTIKLGP
jgi:Tfp pilus assembly protein PilV